MTGVLRRAKPRGRWDGQKRRRHRRTEEGFVKTEAETEGCIYKPRNTRLAGNHQSQDSSSGWILSQNLRSNQPCQRLGFTLPACRAVRQYVYVLLSLQFCGNLSLQSLETNAKWLGGKRERRNHNQTGKHCTGPHMRCDCFTPNSGDGNGWSQEESTTQFSYLTSYNFPLVYYTYRNSFIEPLLCARYCTYCINYFIHITKTC